MSWPDASASLPDRLVTACWNGDLPSAVAAVADGASVNEGGTPPRWREARLPLAAAAYEGHHDVVVWLLSAGADPNGDDVMFFGACYATAGVLQLLLDAGGDVNRECRHVPPLFWAVGGKVTENVGVLLAHAGLDFTVTYKSNTAEQFAHDNRKPAVADVIAQEVGARGGVGFRDRPAAAQP